MNARENQYRYFTTNGASKTYRIRSYKNVNGTLYYSAPASGNGQPTTQTSLVTLPTHFKATSPLSGQAFLTWEYPNYIFSSFNIYKDNLLKATLPVGTLSFQDSAATDSREHFYQIEAVNGGNTAPKVGIMAKTQSHYVLSGKVYSNNTYIGLPGVDIYASAPRFMGRAITDSTGYYQISIPAEPNQTLTIMADAFNNAMTQLIQPYQASSLAAVQSIITSANNEQYEVSFGSTYIHPNFNDDTPASIEYLSASVNSAQNGVDITWTFSNTDYDSVEVYRGVSFVAKVAKNHTKIVSDYMGAPGINYIYQVRSVKMQNNTPIYGNYKAVQVTFPKLNPVSYVQSYNVANAIKIEWGHEWNNHTRYEVTRDEQLVATIMPNQSLVYIDNTGKPSQNYVYKVYAVHNIEGTDYYSEPATLILTFPTIAEVSNLSVTIPTQSVQV